MKSDCCGGEVTIFSKGYVLDTVCSVCLKPCFPIGEIDAAAVERTAEKIMNGHGRKKINPELKNVNENLKISGRLGGNKLFPNPHV